MSAKNLCGREGRRAATEHRINMAAQRLAADKGLDGFTMDDLAAAAEVSRRTLFNYFPSKLDAVLGPDTGIPDEGLAVFRSGGPTGDLFEDFIHLAHDLLRDQEIDREEAELTRRVLVDPRVLQAARDRFEHLAESMLADIRARETGEFTRTDVIVAVRILVVLFDVALDQFLADGETRELHDIYAATARRARHLVSGDDRLIPRLPSSDIPLD